jgi:hypothetical protein
MSLIKRHNPPEDSEALDQRELDALRAENYSVWPPQRRKAIAGRGDHAEQVHRTDADNPSYDDVWPNVASGHSGYQEVSA